MYKPIVNNWNFGDDTIRIIRRGYDGLEKQAKWYIEYKSTPGHTYANALFLGSGEWYSSNLNGDYFEELELLNNYKTFLNGHHFKHHENSDPKKSYGTIEEVYFNPKMHRVEGIIKIENEKSPDMILRLEKGEQVPLSMACKVKYDICSICGNKAYKTKDYCDHLKYHMCEIMDDGRKVYAKNPNPEFFDISEVIKGADPTAFTLRKIALDNTAYNELELNKLSSFDKVSLLERLATIEKKVMGLIEKKNPKVELIGKSIDTEAKVDSDNLPALAKAGILLRPRDFGYNCKCAMFNDLLRAKDRDSYLNKIGYYENTGSLDKGIVEKRSMLNEAIADRMEKNSSKKVTFCSNLVSNDDILKIAAINLSIVYNNRNLKDNLTLETMIVQNNV